MQLSDKDIRIMTIHSSGTKRQMINQALRDHGYQDVTGVPDPVSAKELCETQTFHWIFTPISEGSPINALMFLGLATSHTEFADLRVSLLLDDEPIEVAPIIKKAMELGLLSYIRKADSKAQIEEEITKLFNYIETYQGSQPLVAAEYLRELLKAEGKKKQHLAFEKSMIKAITNEPRLLLNLGEAHCLAGELEKGHSVLDQAELISSPLSGEVNQIKEAHPLPEGKASSTKKGCNVLNLNKVLLVEPDADEAKLVQELLAKVGAEGVTHFIKPQDALDWIKENKDVQLIIFEWNLKGLAGPIFCQKVRDGLGFKVPLSVMNKDLKDSDMPLLREMGVLDRIKKPIVEENFLKDVIWIINQDRLPTDKTTLLTKIYQAIKEKNVAEIGSLKKKYFEHPEVSEAEKLFVNAEISYGSGFYLKAKQYASEVLMLGGDSVQILNLLGKAMMKLREFDGALRCLENAQVISPTNVRRLCAIAEANLEGGNETGFNQSINQAKKLDKSNTNIQEAEAKGALLRGDQEQAKTLLDDLDSLKDIVAFTNNRAVALIRNDRINEGVDLYNDALFSIPGRERSILATIYYNLGLAMARTNRLDESLDYLKKAKDYKIEHLKLKVHSLNKRVQHAKNTNGILELKSIPMRTEEQEGEKLEAYMEEMEELLKVLEFSPGDLTLYKIYYSPEQSDVCDKLVENKIELKKRRAIKRKTRTAS